MIFLSVGLAFLLLGWSSSPHFTISRSTRFVFQLATIGAIYLSADEVASIHETVGKSFKRLLEKLFTEIPTDDKGFFWIPLFAPIALIGLIAVIFMLHKVLANMPTKRAWQSYTAYFALFVALVCLPGVFLFELFEWHLTSLKQDVSFLTCWEETFELLGMYSLFLCAILIARQYRL